MDKNLLCFAVTLVLAGGIVALILRLVWKDLAALLDDVLRLPAGTVFYLRVFAIVVMSAALSGVLGTYNLKKDAAFMEYVWKVAEGLASAFGHLCLVLALYLALVTVLATVLRFRRD